MWGKQLQVVVAPHLPATLPGPEIEGLHVTSIRAPTNILTPLSPFPFIFILPQSPANASLAPSKFKIPRH